MNHGRPDEPTLGRELLTACRRLVLPVVLAGICMVLLGVLVTRVLQDTWLGREDADAERTLAAQRTPTGETLTHAGSLLAETPTIVALTAIAALIFRRVFHRWRESVFLVLCVSAQALIFMITTMVIDRKRPPVPRLDDSPPTSSFPSGHTSAAAAFYGGVALVVVWHTRHVWLKWLAVLLGVAFPVVVAGSRMYRGMHFPSDAAASVLLSASLLAAGARLYLAAPAAVARRRVGGPDRRPGRLQRQV